MNIKNSPITPSSSRRPALSYNICLHGRGGSPVLPTLDLQATRPRVRGKTTQNFPSCHPGIPFNYPKTQVFVINDDENDNRSTNFAFPLFAFRGIFYRGLSSHGFCHRARNRRRSLLSNHFLFVRDSLAVSSQLFDVNAFF